VRRHEHLVIEAEDRVVERHVLVPELQTATVPQRFQGSQGGPDTGGQRDLLVLLFIPIAHVYGIRSRDGDTEATAGAAPLSQCRDKLGVLLRKEVERVPEQIDLRRRL
jgi:hypothetical protein